MISEYLKRTLLVALLCLCGCSTIHLDKSFEATRSLINKTRSACTKHPDNDVLAQKECFPLLAGTRLLVEARGIKSTFGSDIRIEGIAGSDNDIVWCELDKGFLGALLNDPTLVRVGNKYWVEGDFTHFWSMGHYHGRRDYYTIKNCKVTEWKEPQKLGSAPVKIKTVD